MYFQIPADCQACDDSKPNEKIVWRLEVRGKTPGPDYFAYFDVPVFKTGDGAAMLQAAADPTAPYQQPLTKPVHTRNQVRTQVDGSTEFYFPPARNPGPITFTVAFMAVWSVFLGLMITHRTPIVFVIVFGLVDVLMFVFLLGAVCKSSRITIGDNGLVARQNWLLFTITRRFLPGEIREIKTPIGMTSGNTSYYNIQAVTARGRSVTLASSIREKQESDWFATEMRRLLKLDKTAATPNISS